MQNRTTPLFVRHEHQHICGHQWKLAISGMQPFEPVSEIDKEYDDERGVEDIPKLPCVSILRDALRNLLTLAM